ncbi:hypothetical protein EVAR_64524_1 [Eumeta japonica]|uniref:Uncharacterized protein n=1 Tax=Eumeta variegata TaxID=151549 RepID=A0A4C1ZJF0_EUMVA|nr:hypothetical protein EVAR_64524_1 [Eumeta japonica]
MEGSPVLAGLFNCFFQDGAPEGPYRLPQPLSKVIQITLDTGQCVLAHNLCKLRFYWSAWCRRGEWSHRRLVDAGRSVVLNVLNEHLNVVNQNWELLPKHNIQYIGFEARVYRNIRWSLWSDELILVIFVVL